MNSIIDSRASLAAIIHFVVSFFTDRLFFGYWPADGLGGWGRIILFKGMFLLVLLLLWNVCFNLVKGIKDKTVDPVWLKCSLGYFVVLLILTLAVWPGMWEWDEFYILEANVRLHIHVWQSLMSNILYAMSLMLIPFPTGVVIVQIVLVSAIVGYVLSFAFKEFKPGLAGKVIMWCPFFVIPVLYFAQAPIRLGLYSFLELLFVTLLYKLYKYLSWNVKESILAVVLVSVIATWRTEGIYYLVIAPILIWLFSRNKDRRCKTMITVFIVILTLFQYSVQNYLYKASTNDSYEITAYINSVQELVGYSAANDKDESASGLINEIDRVFDTEILINNYNAGMGGVGTFWQGAAIRDYSEEDFSAMKTAYVKLILRYPGVFLKERLKMYWTSNLFISSTLNLQDDERDMVVGFRDSYPLTGIINPRIRSAVVKLLELDYPAAHRIIYHPFVPQLILLLIMIYCLMRKQFGYAGMLFLILARVSLVMLTAPERYFMYYFPTYLIGLVALTCVIVRVTVREENEKDKI